MKKRYAVLGLSVVLALALAVPAFGGPANPLSKATSSIKKTANKALKTAKAAQSTATAAQSAATAASNEAKSASSDAGKALTEAKKGISAAATAQSTANAANGLAKTANDSANNANAAATSAKGLATEAKAAADAAEANANTRIKNSVQVVGEASEENNSPNVKFASAACGAGTVILGGGFTVGGESGRVTVYESSEQLYGGGWFAAGRPITGQTPTWKIAAIAVCGTK